MDDKTIVYGLFNELSTLCLLLDQSTFGRELHFHFDLLETSIVPYQSFADQVEGSVTFIFKAEVIVQIHAAFDDLAAAIAFYFESIVSLFGFGRFAAEKFFEKAHNILSLSSSLGG
jgi:hypothetical protein